MTEHSKFIRYLGWFATFTAICMYFAYIPQIMDNLNGNKTAPLQPLVAAINGTLWVIYGVRVRDIPVTLSNAPGIVFGIIAFITAL